VYKGRAFIKDYCWTCQPIQNKSTEIFQYTNFYSCHPPGVARGFIKGEALRLTRTNPSKTTFEANIKDFMFHLMSKRYPVSPVKRHLGEVQFSTRHSALTQKNQTARKKILWFVMQYCPALLGLKDVVREKWHLVQNHLRLKEFFKEPPLLSYRRRKSLKDVHSC